MSRIVQGIQDVFSAFGATFVAFAFRVKKTGVTLNPSTTADDPSNAIVLAEMEHTWTPSKAENKYQGFFQGNFQNIEKKASDGTVSAGWFIDDVLQPETVATAYLGEPPYSQQLTCWLDLDAQTLAEHDADIRVWGSEGDEIECPDTQRLMIFREVETES